MKTCKKCLGIKELSQFNIFRNNPDGFDNRCRDCSNAILRDRREAQKRGEPLLRDIKKAKLAQNIQNCGSCLADLPLEKFHPDCSKRTGYSSTCRDCKKSYNRQEDIKLRRKESDAARYKEDRNKILANNKSWRENNKEYRTKYIRKYLKDNKEKLRASAKINRARPEVKEKTRTYQRERTRVDMQFKLGRSIRTRLNASLKTKGVRKRRSSIKDLGCTLPELKKYIEKQFKRGMSWSNWGYGPDKWHLDHIMPLSAFDLTNKQHWILACHYGNLQPLWQHDNLTKSAKICTI